MDHYVERATRLAPVEQRVVRESRGLEHARRSAEEMGALREAARRGEAVLLTERGEGWTTADLARYLERRLVHAAEPTFFLGGGEAGYRPEDEAWAPHRLALSRMTLPHELARVVLAEQVYRALTIIRNVKYHK